MNNEKKQRIMQAAEQVFRTRRFHEATLDEIAKQADVGKGTIYLYFSDKEELVFQAAVVGFDEMCHLLRQNAIKGGSFRERLVAVCADIVSYFQARRPLFRIILSEGERDMETPGPGLRQRWRERRRLMTETVAEIIAQGVASGEVRADIHPEILSEYLLGMLRTRSWELEGWSDEQRSHVAVVDLFLNGAGVAARQPA